MKRLIKDYIYCSAMKRSEFAARVEEHTWPVMRVLAQLYLFPNTEYENHWREELVAAFDSVPLLKGGKKASANLIFENTWGCNSDIAERVMKQMLRKESMLTPRKGYTVDAYSELCKIYFKWISEELSKYRIVDADDIYTELDRLGL